MIIEEATDEQLVGQVRGGDRDAFALLVERYKRGIANFIGAGVRSPSDVADLTQETFLRAYGPPSARTTRIWGASRPGSTTIARNVVRTFLGRSQRRPVAAELGEERTLENSLSDPSADADPIGGVLRSEAEAEVRAALADLPERTRTVLALRYYDNMDYQSIATTMGLSLGNVKTLIHRGKLALAQKFREREAAALSGTPVPGAALGWAQ